METGIICIYSIKCLVNNRVYVGQAVDYERRCYQHITALRNNRHWVKDLQDDFNKYGEDSFEFNIVHVYDFDDSKTDEEILDELDELEKFYIKELKAFEDDGGYNSSTGGRKNVKYSSKHKHKLSESKKELFNNDEEFYERFCQIRKEVASRPEFREHLKRIASNRTPEQLKKMSESIRASWTEERRKEKSEEVRKRYENEEERKKTAEDTKKAMEKLKETGILNKPRKKLTMEQALEIAKFRHLSVEELVDKFKHYNLSKATANRIRRGVHCVNKYINEKSEDL